MLVPVSWMKTTAVLGRCIVQSLGYNFEVMRGDRIALICERIFYPELEQVDRLDNTTRGAGGFGSTGVKEVKTKNGNGTATMETKEVEDESDKKKKKLTMRSPT
ncbi:unnamed protein product, partial [Ceratitis capitata]